MCNINMHVSTSNLLLLLHQCETQRATALPKRVVEHAIYARLKEHNNELPLPAGRSKVSARPPSEAKFAFTYMHRWRSKNCRERLVRISKLRSTTFLIGILLEWRQVRSRTILRWVSSWVHACILRFQMLTFGSRAVMSAGGWCLISKTQ